MSVMTKEDMNSTFDNELDALLKKHIDSLKSQPVAQLRALPDMSDNEVKVQGKNISVMTWRENLPNKAVFIIGHISWQTSFWGHSKANGFVIESEGQIRDATSQEWNEYGGL